MEMFRTVNPATGEALKTYESASHGAIENVLDLASKGAAKWRRTTHEERSAMLVRFASELRARQNDLACMISREMGKTLAEARGEIEKSAFNCEHVAMEGPGWLAPQEVMSAPRRCTVLRRPIGTLLAVMPWNFPVWQVFRFLPLALMAGNSVILKHAPNVQGSAENIVDLLSACGLPAGVFQNVRAGTEDIPAMIRDHRVHAVTLTGSGRAGAAVASVAAGALKKSVLELGGSDPFIVLDDADVEAAAKMAASGRYANCGQVCLAPKRFILEAKVADDFITAFLGHIGSIVTGDPFEQGTSMGPMAREDLRLELHRQVTASVEKGAVLLAGGQMPEGQGSFYPPTVLDGVEPTMPAGQEEIFGPVAAILRARDADDAVRLANATAFGLSSNIWSEDSERAIALSEQLDVGGVFVNGLSASDPRLPVGGMRASGYGRELGPWGFDEFVNIQTLSVG